MLIKNTSITELTEALVKVNEKYDGNIKFREIKAQSQVETRFRLTLQVVTTKGPGHRVGYTYSDLKTRSGKPYKGKRMIYACWHVHGDYFDCLFDINPKVEIRVGGQGKNVVYKSKKDNWEDFDVGSRMFPAMLSELCDCGKEPEIKTKVVKQGNLSAEC